MCFGDGDKATKAAERAEAERKKQVADATSAIEQAFGGTGRQGQLDEFIAALRGEFKTEAGRQRDIANRRSRFSVARSGLTGGSAAADAQVRLGEQFQTGLLESERLSQASLSDLVSADEASRRSLIGLAQGGGSVSSAAQNAANALRSNIAGARSGTAVSSLGDIFAESSEIARSAEEAAERRRGLQASQVFADPFSRGG